MSDDRLNLIDDEHHDTGGTPWHVLVVDDEDEVHNITKVALSDFQFAGNRLEFHHAYSCKEAIEIIDRFSDFAVMLVDVVMETDHAGLDFVRYVRDNAGKKFPRIILRTGQPGQAPERKVITEYDINDYKHKTELTQEKMFSVMHTSIASYRDLIALDNNRRGLRKVIEACAELFTLQSMEHFAQGVLEQLTALLYLDKEAMILRAEGFAANCDHRDLEILAGTGRFRDLVGKRATESLPAEVMEQLKTEISKEQDEPIFAGDHFTTKFTTEKGICNVLYISGEKDIEYADRELVQLFCANVAKAQDNLINVLQKLEQSGT